MCEFYYLRICVLCAIQCNTLSQFTCTNYKTVPNSLTALLPLLCCALLWLCVCVVNKLRVSQSQQSVYTVYTQHSWLRWMDGWAELSCAYAYVFIMFCYVAFSSLFSFSYWICLSVCNSRINVFVQWKNEVNVWDRHKHRGVRTVPLYLFE